MPDKYVYDPWNAPPAVQAAAGCVVGKDYPAPIVDHASISKINMERMRKAYAAGRAAGAGGAAAAGAKRPAPAGGATGAGVAAAARAKRSLSAGGTAGVAAAKRAR
jgi:cryptochrome